MTEFLFEPGFMLLCGAAILIASGYMRSGDR